MKFGPETEMSLSQILYRADLLNRNEKIRAHNHEQVDFIYKNARVVKQLSGFRKTKLNAPHAF